MSMGQLHTHWSSKGYLYFQQVSSLTDYLLQRISGINNIFFPQVFIIRLKAIFLVTTTNIKKNKRFQSKKKDQNILLVYVISFLISGISFGYNRCLIGRLSLKDLLYFYLRFGQQEKCLLDFEKCLLNFEKCLLDFWLRFLLLEKCLLDF